MQHSTPIPFFVYSMQHFVLMDCSSSTMASQTQLLFNKERRKAFANFSLKRKYLCVCHSWRAHCIQLCNPQSAWEDFYFFPWHKTHPLLWFKQSLLLCLTANERLWSRAEYLHLQRGASSLSCHNPSRCWVPNLDLAEASFAARGFSFIISHLSGNSSVTEVNWNIVIDFKKV